MNRSRVTITIIVFCILQSLVSEEHGTATSKAAGLGTLVTDHRESSSLVSQPVSGLYRNWQTESFESALERDFSEPYGLAPLFNVVI